MSRMVEFSTAKGHVYVEVDDSDVLLGEVLAANESGVTTKAKKTFEEALQSAKPGTEEALALITDLIKKPAETEIEFGLNIDAAAGAVFAKAGGEATFSIKLTWK
jgi:hypothetical protein